MSLQRVAIIGAGVAGLVAALSFARKGISCDIIEQAEHLTEVGAGLQLSPNATRVLRYLNLLPRLEAVWTIPQSVDLISGRNLRRLVRVEAGKTAENKWTTPYAVLHRATLQRVLLEAVKDEPLCHLHLGHRLEAPNAQAIRNITGVDSQLTVGADGVWSRARNLVPGHGKTAFTGFIAWRFVVPTQDAPDFLSRDRVSAFTGTHTHLVSYPLNDAGGQNLVAIARGENPGETWSVVPEPEAQRRFAERQFASWHPSIRKLIASSANPTWWPLFGATDGNWTDGHSIALVGDAAHAMLPFAAQGAAMAIEDSYRLASLVSSKPLPEALVEYQTERKARVAKVRARGDFNRFAYHASGPVRLVRDAVFALTPPGKLSAGLDWIYGYDAGA